jgi:hypothetical protein
LVPIKVADVIVATRSARTAGTVGFANTAADFVILIGLLLAALSVARSLSGNTAGIIKRSALGVGGAFLTYTGIKAAGSGIKAAGGLGLREHFGRRAFRKKESKEFKEFEASWPRMGEFFGDKLSKIAGAKFGGKQGYEEKIKKQADKIKDFRGDPELQATYLRTLGADAKARAMEQLSSREKANLQDHINLPKDSVAYRAAEAELQNRGVSSANISAKINTLRDNRQTRLNIDDLVGKLPVEEKEKIIKARREAEKQAGEEASRKIAENTIASLKPSRVMYNRLLAPDATINAEAKDDLRSVLTKIKGDQIKKLAEVIDVASPQNKAVTIEILNGLGRNKISELAKYFDEKQLIGVEIQQPSGNTTKHQLNQETIEYIKHGPQNTAFGFYDKAAGWRSNAPPIHPSGWLVQKDLRGNWFAVNPNNSGQQETFDPNTKMWS